MNRLKYILTLTFCILSLFASGQHPIKKYVQEKSVRITTIAPESTNFSDLEAVGKAINNAKIVMLGEQDHGDAPTFLAKTRLIKYLHEQKGFNILAFESDFFSLNHEWDWVMKGNLSVGTFVRRNITHFWSLCDACSPLLYEYIPASLHTNSPLIITGFDDIMNTRKLIPQLDSVIHSLQLPITNNKNYDKSIYPLIESWYNYTHDSITNNRIDEYLVVIKSQMLEKMQANDFWIKTIENFIRINHRFYNGERDYWRHMNERDSQMAINLKWLNEVKYPNEKIIVWAHNYHVSKYAGNYPDKFLNPAKTMGSIFTSDPTVMNNTYIIAFTSYQGTAGRIGQKPYKIKNPKSNSLENWINKTYDYAFIDFKKFNFTNADAKTPFYMSGSTKGNRYHDSQLAEWTKIYDGVFYIKDMYPCQK